MPRASAAPKPSLSGDSTTSIAADRRRSVSTVPSVLQLSTTTMLSTGRSCAAIASRHASTVCRRLNVTTTATTCVETAGAAPRVMSGRHTMIPRTCRCPFGRWRVPRRPSASREMVEQAPFPFIVGCGRSGTTLARAMLDAHPEFAVPFESYFPVWFARRKQRYETPDGFAQEAFVDDLLVHPQFARWAMDEADVRAAFARDMPASFADAIRTSFRIYAQAHDKPRYADKTPVFVLHIPMLSQMFPEAVFVHLVRDGRDVVLSRTQVAWGSRRFRFETLVWHEQVMRGRADGRRLDPARYLELRYEELVDDPERAAKQMCDLIRADFDPAMLHYYERSQSIVDEQPFPEEHRNLLRPPTKGMRDWRTELSSDQLALFDVLAGDVLDEFDYERVAATTSARTHLQALSARIEYASTKAYRAGRRTAWNLVHHRSLR